MERVQKVIANNGYCSRRKAEELIKKGRVSVNGEVVRELGTLVEPNDTIMVDDFVIGKTEKVYILLNKPRGVVTTTSDDKHRKTVTDIVNAKTRVYPVGRLDYDTTGVLLLTNDGELTNALLHPSNNIEKVYIAKIKGLITEVFVFLSNFINLVLHFPVFLPSITTPFSSVFLCPSVIKPLILAI